MTRRELIATASLLVASPAFSDAAQTSPPLKLKGRLKHSACRWCYGKMKLEDLCAQAAAIGMQSIELLNPDEWPAAKQAGLTCAVASYVKSNPIPRGFNRKEQHDEIIRDLEERLPLVAAAGIPQQIVFSGNRDGQADAEGVKNCILGLKRITPLAEKLGVTIIMELLNSKDHADYQCDHTSYGVAVVEGVASERFKLLYDIYHMQRMEGDVIDTITRNLKHISHFHTGGVPGRHEIDDSQELNYRRIMQALVDAGYRGFIGQEFIPERDPMTSLRNAVALCDV